MKPNHRREPFAVFGIINIQYASFACIGITVGSGSVTDVLDCLIRESIGTLLRPRNNGARDPAQAHHHQAATFFFYFDHNDFPTAFNTGVAKVHNADENRKPTPFLGFGAAAAWAPGAGPEWLGGLTGLPAVPLRCSLLPPVRSGNRIIHIARFPRCLRFSSTPPGGSGLCGLPGQGSRRAGNSGRRDRGYAFPGPGVPAPCSGRQTAVAPRVPGGRQVQPTWGKCPPSR